MSTTSVVLFGDKGTGKTTVSTRLQQLLGLKRIVEERQIFCRPANRMSAKHIPADALIVCCNYTDSKWLAGIPRISVFEAQVLCRAPIFDLILERVEVAA